MDNRSHSMHHKHGVIDCLTCLLKRKVAIRLFHSIWSSSAWCNQVHRTHSGLYVNCLSTLLITVKFTALCFNSYVQVKIKMFTQLNFVIGRTTESDMIINALHFLHEQPAANLDVHDPP